MDTTFPHRSDDPSAAEVREALERVVTSSSIRGSPQLAVFLRYVVEAVLRREGSRLKGYTIGIEALGRDASFDPQVDPIVRVEASRLRRAMDRYYADEGASDPIVITLPRGSYSPTFGRRESLPVAAPARPTWRDRLGSVASRRIAAVAVGVAALVAISAITVIAARDLGGQTKESRAADVPGGATMTLASVSSSMARGNGMPMFYVQPLQVIGQANNAGISPATLSEKMIDAFARFDTVNVVPGAPPASKLGGPDHDYAISGIVEYGEGRATIALKVVDIAEGMVVWSRTFEISGPQDPMVTEDKIIVAAATALMQPYGVIRSRDYARQLTSSDGDPRYRCLLEAAHAFRGYDGTAQRRGRMCLERLIAADPSFEVALSFLAMSYSREYHHGLEGPAGDPKVLEKALRTALRAITMNPTRARAHEVLMVILYSRGDAEAAFAEGAKAIELNRYDMTMLAAYGGRKILAGDVSGGLGLLRRAGEFWEVRPAWQHFYLFLGNYLSGDVRMALYEARLLAAEPYQLGRAAEVLATAASGDAERARTLYDRLLGEYPQWQDARREFSRIITAPEMASRLARDLAAVKATATQ